MLATRQRSAPNLIERCTISAARKRDPRISYPASVPAGLGRTNHAGGYVSVAGLSKSPAAAIRLGPAAAARRGRQALTAAAVFIGDKAPVSARNTAAYEMG